MSHRKVSDGRNSRKTSSKSDPGVSRPTRQRSRSRDYKSTLDEITWERRFKNSASSRSRSSSRCLSDSYNRDMPSSESVADDSVFTSNEQFRSSGDDVSLVSSNSRKFGRVHVRFCEKDSSKVGGRHSWSGKSNRKDDGQSLRDAQLRERHSWSGQPSVKESTKYFNGSRSYSALGDIKPNVLLKNDKQSLSEEHQEDKETVTDVSKFSSLKDENSESNKNSSSRNPGKYNTNLNSQEKMMRDGGKLKDLEKTLSQTNVSSDYSSNSQIDGGKLKATKRNNENLEEDPTFLVMTVEKQKRSHQPWSVRVDDLPTKSRPSSVTVLSQNNLDSAECRSVSVRALPRSSSSANRLRKGKRQRESVPKQQFISNDKRENELNKMTVPYQINSVQVIDDWKGSTSIVHQTVEDDVEMAEITNDVPFEEFHQDNDNVSEGRTSRNSSYLPENLEAMDEEEDDLTLLSNNEYASSFSHYSQTENRQYAQKVLGSDYGTLTNFYEPPVNVKAITVIDDPVVKPTSAKRPKRRSSSVMTLRTIQEKSGESLDAVAPEVFVERAGSSTSLIIPRIVVTPLDNYKSDEDKHVNRKIDSGSNLKCSRRTANLSKSPVSTTEAVPIKDSSTYPKIFPRTQSSPNFRANPPKTKYNSETVSSTPVTMPAIVTKESGRKRPNTTPPHITGRSSKSTLKLPIIDAD